MVVVFHMKTRSLYPHQTQAMRYARRVRNPALFVEMRLGKTLVVVRRCKQYHPRDPALGLRVLVVAPGSALGSWEQECGREGCSVAWLTGRNKQKRREALATVFERGEHPSGVFALLNKEGWSVLPEIARAPWDAVVLDESTFIKNPRAKVTKFFLHRNNFAGVPHRWVLTGTPCPEGDADFFCQLQFIAAGGPPVLGCMDYWRFRQRYMEPDVTGFGWVLKPGAPSAIRREVSRRCFVLRRSDAGMEREKVYERRAFVLPQKWRREYDDMEANFENEHASTIWAGATWQWLRQLASGFVDGELVWSDKLRGLVELLRGELAPRAVGPVVVWCCFNAEVHRIASELMSAGIRTRQVTGATEPRLRRDAVREFGRRFDVLVLQQAVAQTGMDLSASSTAVYYSTPVSQFARVQTEDRILSLRKREPLLYVDMVTRDTVDEDVQRILRVKKQMSEHALGRALAMAMKERRSKT